VNAWATEAGTSAYPAECDNTPRETLTEVLRATLDESAAGKLRVTWRFDANSCTHGTLDVRTSDGKQLQLIGVDVPMSWKEPELQVLDVNDDGFPDILFYRGMTGIGTTGTTRSAEVFMWAPKLGQFVRSKTLSRVGDIEKSRKAGCVDVSVKCSASAWNQRTICFDQSRGLWRETANDECRSSEH
jgi:hypothetical protein